MFFANRATKSANIAHSAAHMAQWPSGQDRPEMADGVAVRASVPSGHQSVKPAVFSRGLESGVSERLTLIRTRKGWLYLARLLNLYSQTVNGWVMGARLTGGLRSKPYRRHSIGAS